MTPAEWIGLAIETSIVLHVFSFGLEANHQDAIYVFRHPALLARSLLSMSIVMPLFAIATATLFNLDLPVKIAIIALSVSPVPPGLPRKQTKAGGTASYAVGLLFSAAVLAIVLVPAAVALIGRFFGMDAHLPLAKIAPILLESVILPLIAGIAVRSVAPEFAGRIARPVESVGTILLIAAAIPLLFEAWPQLAATVGNGTLLVLALFALVGVAVGHLLGGPDPNDRTVLALATATRHPAVAMAIAGLNGPPVKGVLAVILWHLIVSAIVSIPYVKWRSRTAAASAAGTAS